MRRRTLLASTAGLAGLAAGTGCVGTLDLPGSGPTTVELFAFADVYERREKLNELLRAAGLEGVEVNVLEPTFETVPRRSRVMQVLGAGKEDPALMLLRGRNVPAYVQAGHLDPLTAAGGDARDALASRVADRCFESVLAPAAHSRGLYGVPAYADAGGLFYRRDLLSAAGYDPDLFRGDPPTWERFAEVVADVRDATSTAGGYGVQADEYLGLSCCTFRELLASLGGGYFGSPTRHAFGPVGDRPVTVDSEPVRRALALFGGLIHGGDADGTADVPAVVPERALEWTEEPSRKAFARGDLVALRNWPYVVGRHAGDDSLGTDLGLAPLPRGVPDDAAATEGTGGSRTSVSSLHFVPNPHAPPAKQRAVTAVLDAVATSRFRRSAFEAFDWLPPAVAAYDAGSIRSHAPYGRYLDAYRRLFERGVPVPGSLAWPRQARAIYEAIHRILAGAAPADATLGELQSTVSELEADAEDEVVDG